MRRILLKTAFIAAALFYCFGAYAVDGSTVANAATGEVNKHGTCYDVTNNHASGNSIFIPTKTNPEWTSFYTNPPAGVATVACAAAASQCYNAANVGTVGTWSGCNGMLIVSTAQLRAEASGDAGGNESYDIVGPDTNTYTFADSTYNIFTGQVTDFYRLFRRDATFNDDIGYWDTSNVTNMSEAFKDVTTFNQNIGSWDISKVTNFDSAFKAATAFNQDISAWDTSSVTIMDNMFENASNFNQDLSGWCVSNIASLPNKFADGTTSWSAAKPVWGTCP